MLQLCSVSRFTALIAVAPKAISVSLTISLVISSSLLTGLPLMQGRLLALPRNEFMSESVVEENSVIKAVAELEIHDCSCRAGLSHKQSAKSSSPWTVLPSYLYPLLMTCYLRGGYSELARKWVLSQQKLVTSSYWHCNGKPSWHQWLCLMERCFGNLFPDSTNL